ENRQRLGLVMARAGGGKTAILVQIALDSILRGRQVVHVSIGQSLEKTRTWYDDIFKDVVTGYGLEHADEMRTEVLRQRMIMTFNASTFSAPKLEERLNDLVYQNIFRPACLIIDGFDFANAGRKAVQDLRGLIAAMNFDIWMSAVTHREDTRVSAEGVPAPCHQVADLFDTVIVVQPEKADTALLNIVKDIPGGIPQGKTLTLNTSTLMIKEG
ncbi:MAG: hypothetical protein M0017_00335, partial [Desulfobacteraceae bacterium]|nr:hypothetical protein [Desulfobacteraceae bacterium]